MEHNYKAGRASMKKDVLKAFRRVCKGCVGLKYPKEGCIGRCAEVKKRVEGL